MLCFRSCAARNFSKRFFSSIKNDKPKLGTQSQEPNAKTEENHSSDKIRNIGIMAHIDAGKTTTTERMLLYAGVIRSPGEVHRGDTVMDYMEQERERGITISSAAITFNWMKHKFNLIDTPGHVDFTCEVEKTLQALDGAITILDSSAGVEAQTLTVWRQADRYQVPRIIYLNKMDKVGANFANCLKQIETKLKCVPLPCHLPLTGKDFNGIIDLVDLTVKQWELGKSDLGTIYSVRTLNETSDLIMWEKAVKERTILIDKLADLDDELASLILERNSLEKIETQELKKAIRRACLSHSGVPVFCGSSYRNVAVQPLMNAVVDYLPSPNDRFYDFVQAYASNQDLCALAFKIQNDTQRGPLTFMRIYSGQIETGQKIYNVTRGKSEKSSHLYVAAADELNLVPSMTQGNIVVVTGLKETITGDTISSGLTAVNAARRWQAKKQGVAESEVAPILAGVEVPEPVFFCSIETASLMYQKQLEYALEMLKREDPSLKVNYDSETGQTILSGMGELHLEVILERIRTEYKVDASLGPFQVAYKETVVASVEDDFILEKTLAGAKQLVKMKMSVEPDVTVQGFAALEQYSSKEVREQLASVWSIHMKAAQRGVTSALSCGPLLSFPVTGVRIFLHSLEVGKRTSELMVAAAASQCVAQLLRKSGTILMEPFMKLEVTIDERYLHAVLGDLAQHRSDILEVTQRNELKVVVAECPLAELRGYSKRIRIITSGSATFTIEFSRYKLMSSHDQRKAMQEVTGVEV